MRDELADAARREGRVDHQREGRNLEERDRREVARELVAHIRIDVLRAGHRAARQQQGVAIGRRFGDKALADHAAGARPVLDDELLPEELAHLGRHLPRHEVVAASRSDRDDDAHRLRRIALRKRAGA